MSFCCCSRRSSSSRITKNTELRVRKSFSTKDISSGKLSPEQVYSLSKREEVELVPSHQVNFLNEEVVEKGFLSKDQYYLGLSNLNLIKRIPADHFTKIPLQFLQKGLLSSFTINKIMKKSPISKRFISEDTKNLCKRINTYGQLKHPDPKETKTIKIFEKVYLQRKEKFFQSSLETHPFLELHKDIDTKERPLAVIFKCHEKTDYNGSMKDSIIYFERLKMLSKKFNILQYRVAFQEEMVEILTELKDEGKDVTLSMINGHSCQTALSLGGDPTGNRYFSNVVSTWGTAIERKFKGKKVNKNIELDSCDSVIKCYQGVFPRHKPSFLAVEGCETGKGKSNLATKFSKNFDNTVVFGCQEFSNQARFMFTSTNPSNISFSLITKAPDYETSGNLKESIFISQGSQTAIVDRKYNRLSRQRQLKSK